MSGICLVLILAIMLAYLDFSFEKKILPKYFRAVKDLSKTFELRRDEDGIEVGDILVLREWDENVGYTGDKVTREVTYVLRDCPEYGLQEGYCIIGMQPLGWERYAEDYDGYQGCKIPE